MGAHEMLAKLNEAKRQLDELVQDLNQAGNIDLDNEETRVIIGVHVDSVAQVLGEARREINRT